MSAPTHQALNTDGFGDLVLRFAALRSAVRRATDCADVRLCEVFPHHAGSLQNLHAYLALRDADLGPLQQDLDRLGLASLDHAEAHVLATLDAALANLYLLHGQEPDAPGLLENARDFEEGPARLDQNTDRLFGAQPGRRRARIMVTLPDDAPDNPALLQALLREGMDCARVNCAYGDRDAWARTIRALREAQTATGRPCRLFMDLRGPSLRNGPMEMQPGVVKVRPRRARDGRVMRAARIWLTAAPETLPAGSDASLTLDRKWLQQLRPGDRIRLRDARGSGRKWRVAERTPDGCWAESPKTTYLVNGTELRLGRRDGRPDLATTLATLAPQESRMTIREGDILDLQFGSEPGIPARHDPDGRLLHPGTLPLDVAAVFRDARTGEPISFDDGRIAGVIEEAGGDRLRVRIVHTRRPVERLSGAKGINLPATTLNLPALSDEDLRDLEFVAHHADIVGLSFTNEAADVRCLYERLSALGKQDLGVVFKIETRRGCANLPAILIEAMRFPNYGVLLARGDLAAECGFERLAELQDDILRLCESAHAPVVWATGVLEGLARSGHPARAEITDAATAQRAECVMLGKGRHIIPAVRTLDGLLSGMREREHKHRSLLGALRLFP